LDNEINKKLYSLRKGQKILIEWVGLFKYYHSDREWVRQQNYKIVKDIKE
jgi:hypothetical protein